MDKLADSENFRAMDSAKNPEELMEAYKVFAPNYDDELERYGHKKHLAVEEVIKIVGNKRNMRILDVAAGTGIGGKMLKNAGFTNIDALDGSQEMLDVAEQKNCYKKLICALVLGDKRLPIEDGTYEIIIMIGGMAMNHIREDCYYELARILKPGGSIVALTTQFGLGCGRELYEKQFKENDENNLLKWISCEEIKEYLNECDGLMYTFKKPDE